MKGIRFIIVMLAVFSFISDSYAKSDVDITRGQFWGHLIFRSKLHKCGIGIDAEFGTKYNYYFSQVKNGREVNTETQDWWLNEFLIGPMWSGTVARNLKLMSSLLYRPRGFFLVGEKSTDPEPYWRHTVYWPTQLTYTFSFMSISYRLALWNWFEKSYKKQGNTIKEDNEFIMRHLVMLVFPMPFYKPLKIDVGYEIFHLTTAEKKVQQQFFKHHIIAGLIYKPVKVVTIKLEYWYQMTYPEESEILDKDITDHYCKLTLVYFLDITAHKKREKSNGNFPDGVQEKRTI